MTALARSLAILSVGIVGLLAPCSAHSQSWPNRPVQLIVAFLPGGVGDIVARAVSDKLSASLGQPVTIENRPGSTGAAGTRSVVRAAPDGYTLLAGQPRELVATPPLPTNLGYPPARALRPVRFLPEMPLALAVPRPPPAATID